MKECVQRTVLIVALSALVAGCGKYVPIVPPDAGGSSLCVPGSCAAEHICLRGTCVSYTPDDDGDGFDKRIDCDDGNAGIGGPHAERACRPDAGVGEVCVSGREVCNNAAWATCAGARVGAECQCSAGETDVVPCDRCGTQGLSCVGGEWAVGECGGGLECNPGELDSAPEGSCGVCGVLKRQCQSGCTWSSEDPVCVTRGVCATGTSVVEEDPTGCGACGRDVIKAHVRERSCDDECQWGAWSAWSSCKVVNGCEPGDTKDPETAACPRCGSRSRSIVCSPETCTWSPQEWSACTGQGECEGDLALGVESESERADARCGACDDGTKTRTRTCGIDCAWASWPGWSSVACDESAGGCDAGVDPDADAGDDATADADGGPGGDVWSTSCASEPRPAGCAPMVRMPGGTFELGQVGAYNAEPVQAGAAAITVSSFYLDAYEVTVARFRAYVEANGGTLSTAAKPWPVTYPAGPMGDDGWPGPQDAGDSTYSTYCTWTSRAGANEAHPINCVDWYTAMAFCAWDGGRLPTESEWEYAARGRSVLDEGLAPGRTYPWGEVPDPTVDSDDCGYANYYKSSSSTYCSSPAGTEPVGLSANRESGGVWDLAGNVWEWTADAWGSYPAAEVGTLGNWASRMDPLSKGESVDGRVVRGGSWNFLASSLRSAVRNVRNPDVRLNNVGFRCARTP